MNTNWILSRGAIVFALASLLCAAGCKHTPPKSNTPVVDTQAPVIRSVPRAPVDPREREFQLQIESMQDEIRNLRVRTEAMAGVHGVRMTPKWVEKVKAAREKASRPAERIRYLEATKALLARQLEALRTEMKVYEEFQASDPSIPRP